MKKTQKHRKQFHSVVFHCEKCDNDLCQSCLNKIQCEGVPQDNYDDLVKQWHEKFPGNPLPEPAIGCPAGHRIHSFLVGELFMSLRTEGDIGCYFCGNVIRGLTYCCQGCRFDLCERCKTIAEKRDVLIRMAKL